MFRAISRLYALVHPVPLIGVNSRSLPVCHPPPPPYIFSIYHGAKGAMLVYDITSQTLFDNSPNWLDELQTHVHPQTVILLIDVSSVAFHSGAGRVSVKAKG